MNAVAARLFLPEKKPGISCKGRCQKKYNTSCVGFPSELLKFPNVQGLKWTCSACSTDNGENSDISDVEDDNAVTSTQIISQMNKILKEIKTHPTYNDASAGILRRQNG